MDIDDQGTSWYEYKDKPIRAELVQRIEDLKQQKADILSSPDQKTTTDKGSVTRQEAAELRKSGEWEQVKNKAGEEFIRNKSNPKELKKIS